MESSMEKLRREINEMTSSDDLREVAIAITRQLEAKDKIIDNLDSSLRQARQIATKFEQNNGAMYDMITEIGGAYKATADLTEDSVKIGMRAVSMILDQVSTHGIPHGNAEEEYTGDETGMQLMQPDGSGVIPELSNDPMGEGAKEIAGDFIRE